MPPDPYTPELTITRLYALYPNRNKPKKLTAFIDFLSIELEKEQKNFSDFRKALLLKTIPYLQTFRITY
jgi:hypothetical protein